MINPVKFLSRKQAFNDDPEKGSGGAAFDSPEELVTFTQKYFSSDFPNPERLDCPVAGTWSAQALSSKSPDNESRKHLFGCSECFKEYRRALAAQRSTASASTVSWWSRLKVALAQQRTPAFAGAFSLLLLSFIGAYVWQEYKTASKTVVERHDAALANTSPDSSSKGISTSVTPETATDSEAREEQPARNESRMPINRRPTIAQRSRSTAQVPRDLVAMNTVKADLEDYTSLRGGADAGNGVAKGIRVSRPRTRLLLTLPEGSIEGLYQVSIVDNSGNVLATANARSANGKTIIATLDLQRLPVQKYRLRISREGEVPGYYPVIVEDQKPTSRGMKP